MSSVIWRVRWPRPGADPGSRYDVNPLFTTFAMLSFFTHCSKCSSTASSLYWGWCIRIHAATLCTLGLCFWYRILWMASSSQHCQVAVVSSFVIFAAFITEELTSYFYEIQPVKEIGYFWKVMNHDWVNHKKIGTCHKLNCIPKSKQTKKFVKSRRFWSEL